MHNLKFLVLLNILNMSLILVKFCTLKKDFFFCLQSEAVAEAIYSCRWYNHSAKFKKLVHVKLMRAQKPVLFSAGGFFDVSLQSFGEVRSLSLFINKL